MVVVNIIQSYGSHLYIYKVIIGTEDQWCWRLSCTGLMYRIVLAIYSVLPNMTYLDILLQTHKYKSQRSWLLELHPLFMPH